MAHPVRYSQPTDAGQMEISGPPLTALSADELRDWVAFLHLIIRQAERLAKNKDDAFGSHERADGEALR